MRTLYYVPMLHTQKELGSLKEKILEIEKRRYGTERSRLAFQEIENFWKEVARRIKNAGLFGKKISSRLHVFIDGLPDVDDKLVQVIVADLIKQDIPIYRIVEKLQKNGAEVHGTEDPNLLKKEYGLWTKTIQGEPIDRKTAQVILEARDRAIANRINEALPDNEIGILFIGRAHEVIPKLKGASPPLEVQYL